MSEPSVQDLFNLSGRVALVTGASGHLGKSLAVALAELGASVVVASRDRKRGEESAATLPARGSSRHHAVVIDYCNEASITAGFADAVAVAGQVDVLVNNGHDSNASDLTDVSAEQFNRMLSNATGYFLLSRMFRDHVVDRSSTGSIVMLGSMYGVVGSYPAAYDGVCPASPVHYHALKGGIVHMTRHLAVYWAENGIRVNCLSPGPFPGPAAPEEMVERLIDRSPMRRMGRPHELKGAVALLASDAGSYLTGQNLLVDGGWTAW